MFRLLKEWWRRRRQNQYRMLFTFWDGERTRRVDPWRIYRELLSQPKVDIVAVATLVDKGQEPETSQVVEAIAEAFRIKRWDGLTQTGLMDCEILNLMSDLDEYLLAIKKKFNLGPTSPPPTE